MDSVITGVITRTEKGDSIKQQRLKKVNGKLNKQVREEFGFEDAFSFHNPNDSQSAADSIVDFRPLVKVPGQQAVYLTSKRTETL